MTMKKIFYYCAALFFCAGLTSCEKEEIGGSAIESMAGQWYVQVDAVDDNGNPIEEGEDYFGKGKTILLTYNTANESTTEMWLDNLGEWNIAQMYDQYFEYGYIMPSYNVKTRVKIDLNNLTFSSTESENFGDGWDYVRENSVVYSVPVLPVTIEGKILPGAGRQNNGSVADSIVFFITYKNDPWYPDDGYAKYKVSGIRYSGLAEND